jgi:predicted flavoprotein YhiN
LASRGLEAETKAAVLTREGRRLLAASLAEDAGHPFPVASLGGWDEAMASRGGVDLGEIDAKTMQSRLVSGLFFAGEVLDVDGDTGGFNIQAAVSTGFLAGMSAAVGTRTATEAGGAAEANAAASEPAG